MKSFTSIISLLIATGFVADASATTSSTRGRPGSISGAFSSRAVTNSDTMVKSTSGTTTETESDAQVVDKEDPEIEMLGVKLSQARTVCNSIYADAKQAVFDETTYECSIPVVAHNWSGVIQKDDETVVAYVPMGTGIICNEELFDQVSALRRSSQWVVPTMVVGAAGAGAGVGALMDRSQEKKVEEFKKQTGLSGIDANAAANLPKDFSYNGKVYDLTTKAGLDALKKELNAKDIQKTIDENFGEIAACMRKNFKELVSTRVDGVMKFGGIVIRTDSEYCATSGDNGLVPLEKENVLKRDNTATSVKKPYTAEYVPNGKCYFRYRGKGQNSVPLSNYSDNSFSYDIERWTVLTKFNSDYKIPDGIDKSGAGAKSLLTLQELLNKNVFLDQNSAPLKPDSMSYGAHIQMGNDKTFGDIVGDVNTAVCNNGNTLGENSFVLNRTNYTLSVLSGALQVLLQEQQDENIKKMLGQVNGVLDANSVLSALEKEFGSKNKTIFQKNVGKGLIVGAGVGAAAGIGYWFAEGASVFCNVGGLEQVKMKDTYSIPSFREFIVKYNYAK